MRRLKWFAADERGSLPRRFAHIAVVAAVVAVAAASMLDRMTRDGASSIITFLLPQDPATVSSHSPTQMALRGVDTTPTGSIAQPIVLDPCTGQRK
jgi:hypothetical protein